MRKTKKVVLLCKDFLVSHQIEAPLLLDFVWERSGKGLPQCWPSFAPFPALSPSPSLSPGLSTCPHHPIIFENSIDNVSRGHAMQSHASKSACRPVFQGYCGKESCSFLAGKCTYRALRLKKRDIQYYTSRGEISSAAVPCSARDREDTRDEGGLAPRLLDKFKTEH